MYTLEKKVEKKIGKEYSLIGKIGSFKLQVFSSSLSALVYYLRIINHIMQITK
jgi:hypothetical protein